MKRTAFILPAVALTALVSVPPAALAQDSAPSSPASAPSSPASAPSHDTSTPDDDGYWGGQDDLVGRGTPDDPYKGYPSVENPIVDPNLPCNPETSDCLVNGNETGLYQTEVNSSLYTHTSTDVTISHEIRATDPQFIYLQAPFPGDFKNGSGFDTIWLAGDASQNSAHFAEVPAIPDGLPADSHWELSRKPITSKVLSEIEAQGWEVATPDNINSAVSLRLAIPESVHTLDTDVKVKYTYPYDSLTHDDFSAAVVAEHNRFFSNLYRQTYPYSVQPDVELIQAAYPSAQKMRIKIADFPDYIADLDKVQDLILPTPGSHTPFSAELLDALGNPVPNSSLFEDFNNDATGRSVAPGAGAEGPISRVTIAAPRTLLPRVSLDGVEYTLDQYAALPTTSPNIVDFIRKLPILVYNGSTGLSDDLKISDTFADSVPLPKDWTGEIDVRSAESASLVFDSFRSEPELDPLSGTLTSVWKIPSNQFNRHPWVSDPSAVVVKSYVAAQGSSYPNDPTPDANPAYKITFTPVDPSLPTVSSDYADLLDYNVILHAGAKYRVSFDYSRTFQGDYGKPTRDVNPLPEAFDYTAPSSNSVLKVPTPSTGDVKTVSKDVPVTDYVTGKPVAGIKATMYVYGGSSCDSSPGIAVSTVVPPQTVTSDDKGILHFTDIPEGNCYEIRILRSDVPSKYLSHPAGSDPNYTYAMVVPNGDFKWKTENTINPGSSFLGYNGFSDPKGFEVPPVILTDTSVRPVAVFKFSQPSEGEKCFAQPQGGFGGFLDEGVPFSIKCPGAHPLDGAEFTLTDKSGKVYPMGKFVKNSGEVMDSDPTGIYEQPSGSSFYAAVPMGEYILTETKAPAGYLAAAPRKIVVGDGDDAMRAEQAGYLSRANSAQPHYPWGYYSVITDSRPVGSDWPLPRTGGDGVSPTGPLAALGLALLGTFASIRRRFSA